MKLLTADTITPYILGIFFAAGLAAGAAAKGLYNKPVYNPETKSYFELYSPDANDPKWKNNVRNFGHIKWANAKKIAENRWYNGVRGRLAIVKSPAAHQFLKKTFKPTGPVWIGLRYWCRFRKLQWVNGDVHKLTAFQAWGPVWNIAGPSPIQAKKRAGCIGGNRDYLPVHYWEHKHGFVWNANGRDKDWNQLFIEYPTGKE